MYKKGERYNTIDPPTIACPKLRYPVSLRQITSRAQPRNIPHLNGARWSWCDEDFVDNKEMRKGKVNSSMDVGTQKDLDGDIMPPPWYLRLTPVFAMVAQDIAARKMDQVVCRHWAPILHFCSTAPHRIHQVHQLAGSPVHRRTAAPDDYLVTDNQDTTPWRRHQQVGR